MNHPRARAAAAVAGAAPQQVDWNGLFSALASAREKPVGFGQLAREPELTVASVLLIVVSIGWLVIARLVVRNLRRAAAQGRRSRTIDAARPPRDIWSMPP